MDQEKQSPYKKTPKFKLCALLLRATFEITGGMPHCSPSITKQYLVPGPNPVTKDEEQ
jgi:hypothetical protein